MRHPLATLTHRGRRSGEADGCRRAQRPGPACPQRLELVVPPRGADRPLPLHLALLPPVPGVRGLHGRLHGLGLAARLAHLRHRARRRDVRRAGQLRPADGGRAVLALGRQHDLDPPDGHDPADVPRAGARRAPQRPSAAWAAPLPQRAADPQHHLRGGDHDRLPVAVRSPLRPHQRGPGPARLRDGELDGEPAGLASGHRDDGQLAVDRLQHADLPGGDAVDPQGSHRGCAGRRGGTRHALVEDHRPPAAPDDPVRRRAVGHRQLPAVRAAAAVRSRGGLDGGNDQQFLTILLYLYNVAFRNFQFGYASAIAWALVVLTAVAALVVYAGVGLLNWRDNRADLVARRARRRAVADTEVGA